MHHRVCVCVPASACGGVYQARRWQGVGRGLWTWLLGSALPVTDSEGDIARPWLPQLGQSGVSAPWTEERMPYRRVQRCGTDRLMDSNMFSTVSAALCWSLACVYVQIMKVTVCLMRSLHPPSLRLLCFEGFQWVTWTKTFNILNFDCICWRDAWSKVTHVLSASPRMLFIPGCKSLIGTI